MAHTITDLCNGCGACKRVCPMDAIRGEVKSMHEIIAEKCIDCSVCGMGCPKGAILDSRGNTVQRLKISERAKPVINAALCTGCFICGEMCHMKVITIATPEFQGDIKAKAIVNTQKCVGCGYCVSQCPMDAITMVEPVKAASESAAVV